MNVQVSKKLIKSVRASSKLYDGVGDDVIIDGLNTIAHHEAGHIVARVFTGHEDTIEDTTIFPHGEHWGGGVNVRGLVGLGRWDLFYVLAGKIAEIQAMPDGKAKEDMFNQHWEWEMGDEGTDYSVARDMLADVFGDSLTKTNNAIWKTEAWAREFFEMPEAWAAVEGTAKKLLKDGEIPDFSNWKHDFAFPSIRKVDRKWARRLLKPI